MPSSSSPAISIPALLFSVAVVGALIGFGWEHVAYGGQSSQEWSPPEAQVGTAPDRPGRTPLEEALLKRALSHFPPYPRASRPEVLAADYLGPGVPMAVAWFSTEDAPGQVLEHYEKALLADGLPVLSHRFAGSGGYVGHWSPATEEVRLVSVLAQGGETLVFVSAGQVSELLKRAQPVPDWVPLPGVLLAPLAITFDMEGAKHHLVSGALPEGTLAEVEARYRAELERHGWAQGASEPVDAGGIGFAVSREAVRGRAVLRQSASRPGLEVQLSLLEREGAP
jgi:hypothetical protein